MAIPDFQTLMLPLLKITGDGQEHAVREMLDALAEAFRLTPQERAELLPSGFQARFDSRVGWARTRLKLAGCLESTGRGKVRITVRGLEVLRTSPTRIDQAFLRQFPEYVEYFRRLRTTQRLPRRGTGVPEEEPEVTPEETLESAHQVLRRALAQNLLARIKDCSPRFFERLVVDLLVAMGYGGSLQDAGQAVGQARDGGIDGIIKEDKLGLDVVCVQAKRWETTVGRPVVQEFAGSLEGRRARKGVLITTSQFSPEAKQYVNNIEKKIVLIDGEELAQLMIDYGIGVSEVVTYTLKKVDLGYFEEE